MHDPLVEAFNAIYQEFMPAEGATDAAAMHTARLLATMLEQRHAAGLPINTGAALIRRLTKSLAAQIEAREEFMMAHKLAAVLPKELGIDPRQYGDIEPCPPDIIGATLPTADVVRLVA